MNKMTSLDRRNLRNGLLFVSPWLLGAAVFAFIPMIMSLYFSFTDYSVLNPPVYIGLGNFVDLMGDDIFFKSLWNTILFAVIFLPAATALSLLLAILLNFNILARPVFRSLFFVPSLVPLVALGVLWGWIYHGEFGVINYALESIGLPAPNWLGDPLWTKPALAIASFWTVGNAVVIYLAGLQDIPAVYYEAARIDGAGWWRQTWHVTLPLLSPSIYFNVMMGTILVLQFFVLPFVMTGPGPDRSTYFYLMYIFDHAFRYFNMGYACAMAWILFCLIALATFCAHKLSKGHVHYGAN